MTDTIHIILPARDESVLSDMLVRITKEIEDREHGGPDGYGLGGAYGYGADYDSDVFMMHRYCWCEAEDCPWCGGCFCPSNDWVGNPGSNIVGGKCQWCRGVHRFAEHGALPPNDPPHQTAPNFWHKPSGMRVWWYKYIGRGMDTHSLPDDLTPILQECLADIASHLSLHRKDNSHG